MILSRQFTLKNTPDALVVLKRLLQSVVPIRRVPVVLAFFELYGCFREYGSFDFTAGLGGLFDVLISSQ
jgi:hypothetical protein